MAEPPRRFPAPWHADPMPGGYVVRDANGQALAYLDFRDNEAEARGSCPQFSINSIAARRCVFSLTCVRTFRFYSWTV
jgi:hypothetical protein